MTDPHTSVLLLQISRKTEVLRGCWVLLEPLGHFVKISFRLSWCFPTDVPPSSPLQLWWYLPHRGGRTSICLRLFIHVRCGKWCPPTAWGPIQVINIRPALIRATLPQPSSSSEALPWCLPWAGETHGPGESLGQRGAAACGLMVPHHAACFLDGKSNILGQRHGFTAAAVKLLSFLTSPSRKISQI